MFLDEKENDRSTTLIGTQKLSLCTYCGLMIRCRISKDIYITLPLALDDTLRTLFIQMTI